MRTSTMRTSIRAAFAAVALGAGMLAGAAPASAADTVKITFTVHGCDRCVITAYQATDPSKDPFTTRATVRRNEAVLTVPANKTKGMSFDLRTPGNASAFGGNAIPVIAIGFEGFKPGSRVTAAQTRASGQQANWCWAGAKKDVTVPVLLQWQHARSQVYAWAAPTLKTYDDADQMRPADAMGHQDVPWCG